jgi:arylsulfatase
VKRNKAFLWAVFALLMPWGAATAGDSRPNVLLILADDLGYSDLGCGGSEIATPNLDALARAGLQIREFYNSARCSPTRAAILTGLHPHQAGFPNLGGKLVRGTVTMAEVLKSAGYRTLIVGKWHLNEATPPTERGFDEFYGMLGGFNSFWTEDPFYTRWPIGREKRPYAKGQFYATDAFADYAIDFLGQKTDRPWFLYLAFNAPHFPLQAPEAEIAKYEGLYFDKGWDRIRNERLARQKALGIAPTDLQITPRGIVPANQFNTQTGWAGREIPPWDSLPEDRRRDLARRMAVYAAMVDRMDQAIGRVVRHLRETSQFENTLIFFLSDNGACAEWDPLGFDGSSGPKNVLHAGDDLKKIGGPESYVSYGSGWANVSNTPYRLFKHYMHEGGVRTPLIVHWPAGLKAHGMARGPAYITDFMPTVCELTGTTYPREQNGTATLPLEGVSLVPAMRGEALPARRIFIEHEGHRSICDGDWKLVALKGQPWELYNLASDPTEMTDRASEQPERVQALAAAWTEWASRCHVPVGK